MKLNFCNFVQKNRLFFVVLHKLFTSGLQKIYNYLLKNWYFAVSKVTKLYIKFTFVKVNNFTETQFIYTTVSTLYIAYQLFFCRFLFVNVKNNLGKSKTSIHILLHYVYKRRIILEFSHNKNGLFSNFQNLAMFFLATRKSVNQFVIITSVYALIKTSLLWKWIKIYPKFLLVLGSNGILIIVYSSIPYSWFY